MAAEQVILPISELSAYQNKWVIKARVTDKAPLRTFAKGGGQGKVFGVQLLDAAGGEIRASFFNAGADKYFEVLEKGKVFTFSKGSVKIANKQYNPTNHKYEITFDKDAVVEPVTDDSSIETIKFHVVNLKSLQTRSVPCTVDLCGVIASFDTIKSVTGKDGTELVKREITIADDSASSLTIALWGDRAKKDDKTFEGNPVVMLKSVSIKEFLGSRAGSLLAAGDIIFNSDAVEAKRIQEWWAQGGSTQELVKLSEVKPGTGASARQLSAKQTNLAGIRVASEQLSNQPELFNVVARLSIVQTRKQGEPQPLHYMACQEPKDDKPNPLRCNKRVDSSGFCVSCNKAGKVAPRLNIRCKFVDSDDGAWLTCFHEAAAKLLGKTGEEIKALEAAAVEKGEAGREELDNAIRACYFDKPMNVLIRGRMGSYNGEARADVSVVDARPVAYAEHGRHMLKSIQGMLAQQAIAGA